MFNLLPLLFIEGFLSFISPCILPMLPIYLAYLAGDKTSGSKKVLINTIGFVAGFSTIFILLGATATKFGKLLQQHREQLTEFGGIIIIILGITYLGQNQERIVLFFSKLGRILPFDKFSSPKDATAMDKQNIGKKELHFFSSFTFGIAFCVGWTPCLFTFLATALTMSTNSDTVWQGCLMLAFFSLGLGLPFIISALFFNKLKSTLNFIKRNLKIIQTVSGTLLILIGVAMLTGYSDYYLRIFN